MVGGIYKVIKQVIVVRTDLNMRKGKIGAQCAHASMKVFFDRMYIDDIAVSDYEQWYCEFTPEMLAWMRGSFTKIVLGCNSEEELLSFQKQAEDAGIINALILDNGQTEFKEICSECNGKGTIILDSNPDVDGHFCVCSRCNGTGKVNKPTYTCLAIGPDKSEVIDKITGHLKPL